MMSLTAEALRIPQAAWSESRESKWYVLYTYPRHEKRVAEQIELRRLSCFLPLYRSVRRWRDRRKEVDLVLFPGYVFVQIALEDKLKVLQVPGVVRLVSFQGLPAALPANEIETLRNRLSHNFKIEPHPYIRSGRRVRVRSGPLRGLEGIVLRRKESCRFIFSIDLIHRAVAIEVDEVVLEVA